MSNIINNDQLSPNKVLAMYSAIKKAENSNGKTQKYDDKQMTDAIVKYITKIVNNEEARGEI